MLGQNQSSEVETTAGFEGNDVYAGRGNNDRMQDSSSTSNDTYRLRGTNVLGTCDIDDFGGGSDILDLSQTDFRTFINTTFTRAGNDLGIEGPNSTVIIRLHFSSGDIEKIKFANETLDF